MTASVAVQPVSGQTHQVSLWLSISALATAFVALAVWFVVTVATANTSSSTSPNAPQGGGSGQYNQLCVPAPGANYC
jgi:hypothetical protein